MKHARYSEAKNTDTLAKSRNNQPRRGISFAEMLAQADAVQDRVWITGDAASQPGGFQPVAGSIQSALAAILQPVPWIGLRILEKKPRRL